MEFSEARLLFVSTSSGLGGSEKILSLLARGERPRWSAVALCSLKPTGPIGRDLEREGIPVFSCGLGSGRGPAGALGTLAILPSLVRVVRQFRPTLVHAFLFRAGLVARLPALLGDAPRLIVSVRRLEVRGLAAHLLDRWSAGAVHRFTAVSEAARLSICSRSGIPIERIERIPNGVEVPPSPDGGAPAGAWRQERRARARQRLERLTGQLPPLILGCVGRLEPVKGHDVLLEAVSRLLPVSSARQGTGLDRLGVVIVGDGRRRRALEALASRPPLAGRVRLLGERTDVSDILPAFDLFVLPSRSEGMSNALLEAMAEGIPVIATRAGGNPEVVEPGVSGALVDPDDPGALAGAIGKLVANAEHALRLGMAGRARVRSSFSLEAMVRAYRHLYWKLLSSL